MSAAEIPSDIKTIGSVQWGFKYSGYVSGLEKIETKMKDEIRIRWFAREVALAVSKPQAVQANPLRLARRLLDESILTQDEIDYIYNQFGFNP